MTSEVQQSDRFAQEADVEPQGSGWIGQEPGEHQHVQE